MERDATKRFSNRVEHYSKHRPGYPGQVLELLKAELKLQPDSVVADIGSGTGILSELFLRYGCTVFGVEPNPEMRRAAEINLSGYGNFRSVPGKAEATGLPDQSIEFIVAGQAFHWFDRETSKTEFVRIQKPSAWTVLLWNDRRQDTSFSNAYENLLKTHAIDYDVIDHRLITQEALASFYGHSRYRLKMFDNVQVFDWEGLSGRVLSCSYMPMPDQPGFEEMMKALETLFKRYQEKGRVTMGYNTLVYYGRIL